MNTINNVISRGFSQQDVMKMLQHFENFNFMKLTEGRMTLGFIGENVKQTIHNEWLMSNSVTCDEPSFLSSCVKKPDLKKVLNVMKPLVKDLPWSIVSSYRIDTSKKNSYNLESSNATDMINACFSQNYGLKLQKYLICEAHKSDNYFDKLQRDRQKWWKKFSATPGQFTLTQTFNDEEQQYVEVQVEFPWGTAAVERIQLFPEIFNEHKEGGINVSSPLHVISSEMVLEKTTFAFICDSYERSEESETIIMRFHRKLAPYKVAFAAVASTPEDERNLRDLALLLTKQIRKSYNSVLLLSDICSTPLEKQIMRNDSLGIPYTVIITGKTLKTGLLEMRSRDTTLQEQSHVGSLAPYVEKLMKNY